VPDHFRLKFHTYKLFPVVDFDSCSNHFGKDDQVPVMGSDSLSFLEIVQDFFLPFCESAFDAPSLSGRQKFCKLFNTQFLKF